MFNHLDIKHRNILVALNSINGLGPRTLRVLCEETEMSVIYIYESATRTELQNIGINNRTVENIFEARKIGYEKIISSIEKNNIKMTTLYDSNYPPLLKEIPYPPVMLFYKGSLPSWEEYTISSIVGTRQSTTYGERVTDMLCDELVAHGDIIVSGLAYGIDACAHRATIKYGGKTIAVLPTSLSEIVPRSHERLAQDIIEHGGSIISEISASGSVCKGSFPQRNRIIAGIAHRTFIIEAGEKSGALITAHDALNIHRDIYVVPGNITNPTSAGCNSLIADGSYIYRGPGSIYPIQSKNPVSLQFNSTDEKEIYEYIKTNEPITTDSLLRCFSSYRISDLNIILSTLELRQLLRYTNGQWMVV